jgi:transposase
MAIFLRLGQLLLLRENSRLYYWKSARKTQMNSSQKRAIKNYRARLSERGLARFEVLGLDADRDLIRALARRLAEEGPEAKRLRANVSQTISGEPPKKGGILAALRRSPLVDADIDLIRPREEGRKVDI